MNTNEPVVSAGEAGVVYEAVGEETFRRLASTRFTRAWQAIRFCVPSTRKTTSDRPPSGCRMFLIQYWGGPNTSPHFVAIRGCACVMPGLRSGSPRTTRGSGTCEPRSTNSPSHLSTTRRYGDISGWLRGRSATSRLKPATSPAELRNVPGSVRRGPSPDAPGTRLRWRNWQQQGSFGTIGSVYNRWATSDRLIGRPPKETASDAPRR